MGCCGSKGTGPYGMVYRIVTPGYPDEYREDRGEAAVLRQARGYTTVIMQVPRAEMEKWQAAQSET